MPRGCTRAPCLLALQWRRAQPCAPERHRHASGCPSPARPLHHLSLAAAPPPTATHQLFHRLALLEVRGQPRIERLALLDQLILVQQLLQAVRLLVKDAVHRAGCDMAGMAERGGSSGRKAGRTAPALTGKRAAGGARRRCSHPAALRMAPAAPHRSPVFSPDTCRAAGGGQGSGAGGQRRAEWRGSVSIPKRPTSIPDSPSRTWGRRCCCLRLGCKGARLGGCPRRSQATCWSCRIGSAKQQCARQVQVLSRQPGVWLRPARVWLGARGTCDRAAAGCTNVGSPQNGTGTGPAQQSQCLALPPANRSRPLTVLSTVPSSHQQRPPTPRPSKPAGSAWPSSWRCLQAACRLI